MDVTDPGAAVPSHNGNVVMKVSRVRHAPAVAQALASTEPGAANVAGGQRMGGGASGAGARQQHQHAGASPNGGGGAAAGKKPLKRPSILVGGASPLVDGVGGGSAEHEPPSPRNGDGTGDLPLV